MEVDPAKTWFINEHTSQGLSVGWLLYDLEWVLSRSELHLVSNRAMKKWT